MGKDYSIYINEADPGPVLVDLAIQLTANIDSISTVRFVANHDKVPEDAIGIFFPDKKEVLIDLGHVLHNTDMYNYGCMYIPGVFYTALWALFHECAHGNQLDNNPELKKLLKLPNDYEIAAQHEAHDCLREWVAATKLPPLEEWGWLGEQISGLVNAQYEKGDVTWINEVDLMKEGACANVEAIIAAWKHEDGAPTAIYNAINDGAVGMKIADKYYLTAIDFFDMDEPKAETVASARTVLMDN